MFKKFIALAICLSIASPVMAEDLTPPLMASATESQVIEGPVVYDQRGKLIHPLELIGEVRDRRAHWYSLKLGTKHYVYKTAENNYHYITTKKIPLVFDGRSWSKQHPFLYGGFEVGKVSAGAMITGAFAWAAAKK